MLHQHPGGLELTKMVVDYCGFAPGAKIVDIGCGAGVTVEYLCGNYKLQAVGVDISLERLQQGHRRSPGLALIQASGDHLPFANGTYDGVIAECSLSVIQQQETVLAECARVLTKGGKLAITDMYCLDDDNNAGYLNNNFLLKILRESGFKVVIWEDHSTLLRQFVASYIMKYGTVEKLRQCLSIPKIKLGYFLLVAEKKT
ncbi:MAG: Glycine/sarcosine/dimethylglycine N-methyltransferase [Firmicutes bacterium]|nr:Glycine/sarcosine/dimethylglycine N-methyltransferase [Bacillota bacterium]